MELGRDGDFGTREYGRWDGAKRERERAGHRFLFETDLHKNLLPVFPSPRFIILFFRLISSSSPSFPTMRRKGKEKRKKNKNKPRRTHSPHLTLHQCGIYIKPNPPPLPGGSSLCIQQQHHISIPSIIIIIERDRLVDFI